MMIAAALIAWTLALAPPSPKELIERLPACEALEGCDATRLLIEAGPRAVPALLDGLRDPRELVRFWVCGVLSQLRPAEAFDPLLGVLGSAKEIRVRAAAAFALGEYRDKRAVPGLIKALADDGIEVRLAAAGALGSTGDPRALPPLRTRIGDKDEEVRAAALLALADLGDTASVAVISLRLVEDIKVPVRVAACAALGRLKAVTAIPRMVAAMMGDKSETVRQECAVGLARTGDPSVRGPLTKATARGPEAVRKAARFALQLLDKILRQRKPPAGK